MRAVFWRAQAQLMALIEETTADTIRPIAILWLLISSEEPYIHIQFIISKLPKPWCHQRTDHLLSPTTTTSAITCAQATLYIEG